MKTLLLILVFIPIIGFSQFKQGVGIEYYHKNSVKMENPRSHTVLFADKGGYAILYRMQLNAGHLEAESLASIFMNKVPGDISFAPTHSEYTVSLAYRFSKFKIKIEHMCAHPIMVDGDKYRERVFEWYTKAGIYYNFK